MNRRTLIAVLLAAPLLGVLVGCSSGPKIMSSTSIPESGFLPNYRLLQPVANTPDGTRIWRYRKAGVNPNTYNAVILDPIYLNQSQFTSEITPEVVAQTKSALESSMRDAVNNRGGLRIVTEPGPGVVRISVGITGAEVSADGLKPWNFTPIGLATNAAAYATGVNSKTPALVIESKITDSQTKDFIGGGVITLQGETFRTGSGSVASFQEMAKRAVRLSMEVSANPTPTAMK
jgi:hypothetical protein